MVVNVARRFLVETCHRVRAALYPREGVFNAARGGEKVVFPQDGNEFALDVLGHACKLFVAR
jgi:hypothetical protein